MKKKQDEFLKALEASLGNVTTACRAVKISRSSYYNRLKDDPFRGAVEAVNEDLIDTGGKWAVKAD